MELSNLTRRTIDNIRLPLILGVVLAHAYPNGMTSANNVRDVVLDFLSRDFTKVCVPIFFAMSAFLLFRGVENFTREIYLKKLKSRTRSVLAPYLVWNAIVLVLFTAKTIITGAATPTYLLDSLYHAFVGEWQRDVPLLDPSMLPFDYPLWFLRDLYAYVLLSPLIFRLLKHAGRPVIALLSVAMLTGLWINLPLLNLRGLLFFFIGAYLGIHGIDPCLALERRRRLITLLSALYVALVILDPVTAVYAPAIHYYIHALQIYTGFVVIAWWFTRLTDRHPGYNSPVAGGAIFGLYLMHGIVDLYFSKLIPAFGCDTLGSSLAFLSANFVVMVVVSLGLYTLINRYLPRLSDLLFSGRIVPPAFHRR